MKIIEGIGSFLSKLGNLIASFLMSAAAPVFFGIVAVVLLFFILRSVYRRMRDKNLPSVSVERSFSDEGVWAGEETELIETVSNRSFLPMIHVDLEAYIFNELRLKGFAPPLKDGMQFFGERFNLWPWMRIRRRHKIDCLRRGYFPLKTATVPTRDDEYCFDCPCELYVYPKPLPVTAAIEAAGRMQGDDRAVRQLFSDPFTLSGVRDYRFGDNVSSINFKASARTWMSAGPSSSPLKVNARDFCANRRMAVFMDFHLERDCGIDGEHFTKRIEVGLSYACALIREAIYGGFGVGFFCNCRQADGAMALRFPIEGGQEHMLAIFKAMAKLLPEDGASFPMLLDEAIEQQFCDCEIYCISLCPSDKTDDRLNTLRRLGNSVHEILMTPMDEELY